MLVPALPSLITCLLLTTFAAAQLERLPEFNFVTPTTGALTGKVVSANGHPAGGVTVELRKADSLSPVTATSTNADGTFELYNIPEGRYDVEAHSGQAQVSQALTVHAETASVHLRLSSPPTAQQIFGATISVAQMLVPESARKEYDKARQAYLQGKYDAAQTRLEQALLIHPQFAAALVLRGVMEIQRQDLEAAQADLEESIQVDPAAGMPYMMLGVVYNHEGRFEEALRASERAVSLSPRAWQGYFEAAKASLAQGMYEKALQFARDAERLGGSEFACIHLIKASALVPMKLYKEAQSELQAFLVRNPKGVDAQQAKGLLAEVTASQPAAPPSH